MSNALPLVADLVESWAPTGGGIRSYIDAKAQALTESGRARHLLIVPGAKDQWTESGPRGVLTIRSPRVPRCDPYRFLLRHGPVLEALDRFRPAVLELGSGYRVHRIARIAREHYGIFVCAFLHTDLSGAYVDLAIRKRLGAPVADLARQIVRKSVADLLKGVDATLVASSELHASLERDGVPRLVRTTLGVDLEAFHPRARTPDLKEALGANRLFTFLGRLDGEKRVRHLLDAFESADAPGAHLLIVGDGPLQREVQARADRWPRIHHLPYTRDRARVAGILASSDVYLSAGPHETFGLAVLEAQSSGLPVLGVNAGALRERVRPETGWLVPPDDLPALACAIREVAALPESALTSMKLAAREQAESGGGWATTLEQLFALYGLPGLPPAPRGSQAGGANRGD